MNINIRQPQAEPYLRAFEYIKRFGLDPTPVHYALFYDYAVGVQSDRQDALLRLMAEDRVNAATLATIDTDAADDSRVALETMRAANDALSQSAVEASKIIAEHASGVAAFNSEVADSSSRLTQSPTNEDLQLLVRNLTLACLTIQERNILIEKQLAEVRENFSELQSSLAELRNEATTDSLTRLLNRRGFDSAISECISSAARTGKPLCLAVCDIDNFKSFNDLHDHLVGDQVIKFIAKTLMNNVREGDIASRFGGEEFALLLPSTSVEEARILAERIRHSVASKRIMKRATKETIGQVTISIGIALYDTRQDPADLFQAADKNLYEAKAGGKNQTVIPS